MPSIAVLHARKSYGYCGSEALADQGLRARAHCFLYAKDPYEPGSWCQPRRSQPRGTAHRHGGAMNTNTIAASISESAKCRTISRKCCTYGESCESMNTQLPRPLTHGRTHWMDLFSQLCGRVGSIRGHSCGWSSLDL